MSEYQINDKYESIRRDNPRLSPEDAINELANHFSVVAILKWQNWRDGVKNSSDEGDEAD